MKNVPSKHVDKLCRALLANSMADFTLQTDGCMDSTDLVHSLEHVQVSVTLGATRRGEVELALTSPSGTRSLLLARRAADLSGDGLTNWVMMTTHCWGERPAGTWTLTVHTGATIGRTARSIRSISCQIIAPCCIVSSSTFSVRQTAIDVSFKWLLVTPSFLNIYG